MDDVKRIDEMRKINFDLDKSLNDYNKNVTELRNRMESGNADPQDIQKSLEHLIERRLNIAEQVGRYDQLATKGADAIGGPSQTDQVTRAKTLLGGALVDFPMDAKTKSAFDGYLAQALNSHKVVDHYTDEIRDLQRDTEKRDKNAPGAQNAVTGVRNKDAERYFERDVKVQGDQRALDEFGNLQRMLTPVAAPVVEPVTPVVPVTATPEPVETITRSEVSAPTPTPPEQKVDAPKGLSPAEVTKIQEQLKALHFNVDVTGQMDHKTQIAFRAFTWDVQALAAKNGNKDVSVNGVYDDKTAAAVKTLPETGLTPPTSAEDSRFHRRAARANESDSQYAESLLKAAKAMNLAGDDGKTKDLSGLAVPADSSGVSTAYNNKATPEAIRDRALKDVARPLFSAKGPVMLSTLLKQFEGRNFDGMKNAPLRDFEKQAVDAFNAASGADMRIRPGNKADIRKALEEINKRGGLGASEQEINHMVDEIADSHAARKPAPRREPATKPVSPTGEDPNQPCVDPSITTTSTVPTEDPKPRYISAANRTAW